MKEENMRYLPQVTAEAVADQYGCFWGWPVNLISRAPA